MAVPANATGAWPDSNWSNIRGIKYLDQSSRSAGEGSHNYVIFDDADVEIKAKFSLADEADEAVPPAQFSIASGKAMGDIESQLPKIPIRGRKLSTGFHRSIQDVDDEAWEVYQDFDEVEDRDGQVVVLRHNFEGGREEGLYEHLTSKDGRFDRERTAWLPLVPVTIREARVKLRDPESRNWIYVGKYDNGFRHIVVVDPRRGVVDQRQTQILWTQFSQKIGKQNRYSQMEAWWLGKDPPRSVAGSGEPRRMDGTSPDKLPSTDLGVGGLKDPSATPTIDPSPSQVKEKPAPGPDAAGGDVNVQPSLSEDSNPKYAIRDGKIYLIAENLTGPEDAKAAAYEAIDALQAREAPEADSGVADSPVQPREEDVPQALDDLGLERGRAYTPAEIRAAYRTAAAKHHPDRGGDASMFDRVNYAYAVLKQFPPSAPAGGTTPPGPTPTGGTTTPPPTTPPPPRSAPVTSARAQASRPEVMSRRQIIDHIVKKLGVPFGGGKFRRAALGFYRIVRPGRMIRTKVTDDIWTGAHEVGHYLHHLLFGMARPATRSSISCSQASQPTPRALSQFCDNAPIADGSAVVSVGYSSTSPGSPAHPFRPSWPSFTVIRRLWG